MTAMGQHGARVADDPGTQPPERRRRQRRVAAGEVASTGERRVRPDRRRAAPRRRRQAPRPRHARPRELVGAVARRSTTGRGATRTPADPSRRRRGPPRSTGRTRRDRRLEPDRRDGRLDARLDARSECAAAASCGSTWPTRRDRDAADGRCRAVAARARRSLARPGDLPVPALGRQRADGRDRVVAPVESPDPANRCAALAEAVPAVAPPAGARVPDQRPRQLPALPARCGRVARTGRGRAAGRTTLSPAILASIAVLVMAFAASIAFVTARGGWPSTRRPATRPSASTVAQVVGAADRSSRSVAADPVADPRADRRPPSRRRPRRRRPTPTPTPTPEPTPKPDADPAADVRPLPAAGSVPGHAELLDLHGPLWRQPVQHRQLLRGLARRRVRPQSMGSRHAVARRPAAAPAAADPLALDALSAAPRPGPAAGPARLTGHGRCPRAHARTSRRRTDRRGGVHRHASAWRAGPRPTVAAQRHVRRSVARMSAGERGRD